MPPGCRSLTFSPPLVLNSATGPRPTETKVRSGRLTGYMKTSHVARYLYQQAESAAMLKAVFREEKTRRSSERSRALDPFIFVIAIVAIVSGGRLVRAVTVELIRRRPQLEGDSPQGGEELDQIRDVVGGVVGRLERLEEERDFYKDLLDSPQTRPGIRPPSAEEG